MTDKFDPSNVDWNKVRREMNQANNHLRTAEQEIAKGFTAPGNDLASLAIGTQLPHDVDELVKGLTSSSSYLRNGTMNYIPE